MTKYQRVLILDADIIPCLTIIRSLGSKGIQCDIASSHSSPLAASSKYAGQLFSYPDPLTAEDQFIARILEITSEHKYDLVIPVTERSLVPLAFSKLIQEAGTQFAMPPAEPLSNVLDKSKTFKLAEELGIPVPLGSTVETVSALESLLPKLTYPVVVKPLSSITSAANDRKQLTVQYAHSNEGLLKTASPLLKQSNLAIQEFVPGIGVGIEIIADRGEIKFAFQHQRIHEVPLTGGGSSYRKSTEINPILLEASQKLIRSLEWHGVAMVEFKWEPETGNYWLMEINGRFWGSLPLASAAGADFPYLLYHLLVNGSVPSIAPAKAEVYCRKLSADIYWYEQVLRRQGDPKLVIYPTTQQLITDLLMLFHPLRHRFDVQSIRDYKPGLIDLKNIICNYYSRASEIIREKRLKKELSSASTRDQLITRLKKSKNILFLCYGNINRSALADVALRNLISDKEIIISSAGFHAEDKRPADPVMVKIAKENGLDMSQCSSSFVTDDALAEADIIFVMDLNNLSRLMERKQGVRDKTFLLGALTYSETNEIEVADPYNKPRGQYASCYQIITSAINKISQQL